MIDGWIGILATANILLLCLGLMVLARRRHVNQWQRKHPGEDIMEGEE